MPQPIPEGYESETFWHPNHAVCPKTGDASPISLFVPIDKTGWTGVTCGLCGQQLQAF